MLKYLPEYHRRLHQSATENAVAACPALLSTAPVSFGVNR